MNERASEHGVYDETILSVPGNASSACTFCIMSFTMGSVWEHGVIGKYGQTDKRTRHMLFYEVYMLLSICNINIQHDGEAPCGFNYP